MARSTKGAGSRKLSKPPPEPLQQTVRWETYCLFLQSLGGDLARTLKKAWHRGWQTILIVSAVLSVIAGALFLFPPKLTVESAGSFDASDPLSASFKIKNGWPLPLYNVQPYFGLCELRIHPQIIFSGNCSSRGAVRISNKDWPKIRKLDIDEVSSVALRDAFDTPAETFSGGDIAVVVDFEPWIVPWRLTRMFRFVAQKERDGKFNWVPKAVDSD